MESSSSKVMTHTVLDKAYLRSTCARFDGGEDDPLAFLDKNLLKKMGEEWMNKCAEIAKVSLSLMSIAT